MVLNSVQAANQGNQLAHFWSALAPRLRMLLLAVGSDYARIGSVGFVEHALGHAEVLDTGGINDADNLVRFCQEGGDLYGIGASGLHTEVQVLSLEGNGPSQELGEARRI